jgi:cytochrome c biogenesis protein CcmG/thiol:disulfide interchange protein DsbE
MAEIEQETLVQPQAADLPLVIEKPSTRILSVGGRFLVVLAVLGLISLLGWGLYQVQKKPLEKGIAPDFTITSFEGETYTLSHLRGEVVIINFWASWCPPCREEAAYLEQTWLKYKDQGVIFIGIDYVDAEKPALAYIQEFNVTYLNGPDLGTRISQLYNIKGVPETYYVAKDGTLRGNHIGPLKSPELDDKIDELLAEPYPLE